MSKIINKDSLHSTINYGKLIELQANTPVYSGSSKTLRTDLPSKGKARVYKSSNANRTTHK